MAQYKVPQDVEADDKLIGPFGFRQFIYLLIAAGFLALCWLFLSQGGILMIFFIIPLIPAIFLVILALPLRKDQPMETYIAALINFYRKPKVRYFNPGQRESTIVITAPKIVETVRTRNITSDDASRRLSFLASVVDSEGLSIKDGVSPVRDEFIAEANATPDMFDVYQTQRLQSTLSEADSDRHAEAVQKMREAIKSSETNFLNYAPEPTSPVSPAAKTSPADLSVFGNSTTTPASASEQYQAPGSAYIAPKTVTPKTAASKTSPQPTPPQPQKPKQLKTAPDMLALAHTDDLSVETIGKVAKKRKASRKADDKEVYISLH